MSGRPGRDRPRRDNHSPMRQPRPSRYDNKPPPPSRMRNPPSRHLWVGNLAQDLTQSTLVDHFYRFGELESVAFQHGRSYAFVNYRREDDAVAALKSLQGFSVAGMPLRVEFAKSDKSSAPCDDSNYQHRNEPLPSRRSTNSPSEPRARHGSPDASYRDTTRTSDNRQEHPSEILWIGFPSFLKVNESILWKQFSPFGEIDKITVFQGRTYAFVQFMSIASACRAKETLQGKLFGNPNVQICFARSDNTSSSAGRRDMGLNIPSSPQYKPNGQRGPSDRFWPDRPLPTFAGDHGMRPPHFLDMEHEDRGFSQNEPCWTRSNDAYEGRIVHDLGRDLGVLGGRTYCGSPGRDYSSQFRDLSPQKLARKDRYSEDQWDVPEDPFNVREPKKMKTNSYSRERELPEFPFHDEQGRHGFPQMAFDFPGSDDVGFAHPHRRLPENPFSVNPLSIDKHDNWNPSHETYQPLPSPFSSNLGDWKSNALELRKSGMKEVWKWEGTIAKGGTPVCRARCFPVGKVMDINLPEFLDCTARTGLDMLAKHYYQATNSWVVFFVAASDADMGYYNEFMHYLGEKQRAAVAKLDERNTLFLVPPSDFSENVLKVAGKLSISGVVLSLEPSSPGVASLPPGNETTSRSHMYAHVDAPFSKMETPSGTFPPPASLLNPGVPASSLVATIRNYDHGTESVSDQGGYRSGPHPGSHATSMGSSWPLKPTTTSGPSRDFTSQSFSASEDYQHSISGRGGSESSGCIYNNTGAGMPYSGGNNSVQHEHKIPTPVPPLNGLQPDQFPVFASSLLGQQIQFASNSVQAAPESSRPEIVGYYPENQSRLPASNPGPQVNQLLTDFSSSSLSQPQQPHQSGAGGNGGVQDESESDPQKRLQATLQLAAALLKQIQGRVT